MTYPQQQHAQNPNPAMPPSPGMPTVVDAPAIGGIRPRIADLNGRAVLIIATNIEKGLPDTLSDTPGKTYDRVTADVLVIDGGPLEFGGNPLKGRPHTMVVQTPYMATGVYISQANLVRALEPALRVNQALSGRIAQGQAKNPAHNSPWNLVPHDESDPARGLGSHYLGQMMTGQFQNPEPTPKFATPAAQAAYAYVQPPTAAPAQPMPPTPPQYAGIPAQAPVSAPAATLPPAPTPAPAPGSYEAYMAQQAALAGQPAPAAFVPPAPASWPEDAWRNLTDQQRASVLGNASVQQVSAAPAAPTQNPYTQPTGF